MMISKIIKKSKIIKTLAKENMEKDFAFGTIPILVIGENADQKQRFITSILQKDATNCSSSSGSNSFYVKKGFELKRIGKLDVKLNILLWDIPSSDRIRVGSIDYYRPALGIFLLYDVNDRESLQKLRSVWVPDINKRKWKGICMLIGMDFDDDKKTAETMHTNSENIQPPTIEDNGITLKEPRLCKPCTKQKREVSFANGLQLSEEHDFLFVECNERNKNGASDALYTLLFYLNDKYSHRLPPLVDVKEYYTSHQQPQLPYLPHSFLNQTTYLPIRYGRDHIIDFKPPVGHTHAIDVIPFTQTREICLGGFTRIDYGFQYAIVGDYGCGKSSFVTYLNEGNFTSSTYKAIQRTDFLTIRFHFRYPTTIRTKEVEAKESYDIKVVLEDNYGEVNMHQSTGKDGMIFAYDVTNRASFEKLRTYFIPEYFRCKNYKHTVLCIVGMKADSDCTASR